MKIKTISKTIRTKMKAWLKTIDDDELRKDVESSIIVTGGCIASLFLKEDVNDFDVYIADKSVCVRLCEYYVGSEGVEVLTTETVDETYIETIQELDFSQVYCFISSSGVMRFTAKKEDKYALVYLTSNAITLSDDVQIITRFTGSPEEIHKNYDYIHATNYWTFEDGLVVNVDAMCSLMTKELRYSGSRYPLCSVIRSRKFIQRGWSITAGQYLKMALQLNELNLKDIDVLRDQLIGVDSAYFNAFLDAINNSDEHDLSTTYLCSLVDEVFEMESLV